MTNAEVKAILESNAVPIFPLQIAYQDWLTAIHMAEEALEKQIPKKPVELNCPRCRFNGIDNSWWVFNFCPECGQRIDWSET